VWLSPAPEPWRAVIDDESLAKVRIAFAESGKTYGAPRVHQELRAAGRPTSTKRVARLMRDAGLVARRPRRGRVVTTDSTHGEPIAPNRLGRQCDVNGVALNQVWFGDITSMPTREGFHCLSTVVDLGSRRCDDRLNPPNTRRRRTTPSSRRMACWRA
jgi:transposase InsO family protein